MGNDLQHIPLNGIDDRDFLEYDMDNLFESYKYTEHSRCHLRRLLSLKIIILTTSQFLVDNMQNLSDLNVNYNGGISLIHFNARSLRIAIMKYKVFFDLLR